MEQVEAAWEGAAEVVAVERPFEEFFELEQERLLRLLWMVTGSLQEAEDIVQEAFLRVWERWSNVSAMDSPAGYLHDGVVDEYVLMYVVDAQAPINQVRIEFEPVFPHGGWTCSACG